MKYSNVREEELKNRIGQSFFQQFDYNQIIGTIDFCVAAKDNKNYYHLWAESKNSSTDIYKMFAQLFLTIKPELNKLGLHKLPPKYFGCFDNEKIAFVEFYYAQTIFHLNDFDWTERASNPSEKTVSAVRNYLKNVTVFYFKNQGQNIKDFIKSNFNISGQTRFHYRQIDKNNFTHIYKHWLEAVKPHINADWTALKRQMEKPIYERDFFLADLNIDDNNSVEIQNHNIARQGFHIVFNNFKYEVSVRNNDGLGFIENIQRIGFRKDNLGPYKDFWKHYKRPPLEEYWNFIVDRQDLLVEQDVRERKGSFFTPQKWVELSQEYIAKVFGINWQDDYYIWDCAAGSGNLLNGLLYKHKIFASDIDPQNISVMEGSSKKEGSNLLRQNIFQFDFLNDDAELGLGKSSGKYKSKLPLSLQKIISDPAKRQKLIIYINPPYAEAGSKTSKENKSGVTTSHLIHQKYSNELSKAKNELFALFLMRIIKEVPGCKIGVFSKLKTITATNFNIFREHFLARFEKGFIVPGNTFDNVKGQFPIAFQIWDTEFEEKISDCNFDVFKAKIKLEKSGIKTIMSVEFLKEIKIFNYNGMPRLSDWALKVLDEKDKIGHLKGICADFQGQNGVYFDSKRITLADRKDRKYRGTLNIDASNLIIASVCFAVQKVIPADWLNDRDQFLAPNDNWKKDRIFQNNCLTYSLFHSSNNIQSQYGTNHWIPFKFDEVDAENIFESTFMTDFIAGKIKIENKEYLYDSKKYANKPLKFSKEATAVFDCGRKLWSYYHTEAKGDVNYINDASFYDIREYFQGRKNDRMNTKSTDEKYNLLIKDLRSAMDILASKIEPKIYEYGFLLR